MFFAVLLLINGDFAVNPTLLMSAAFLGLAILTSIVAFRAIKSKREISEEIILLQKKLRENFEAVAEELIAIDGAGHVSMWNKQAEQSWKWTSDTILGKGFFEILPQFASEPVRAAVKLATKENQGTVLEDLPVIWGDTHRFYQVRVFPFLEGAVLLLRDVTEKYLEHFNQAEILKSTSDFVSSCNSAGNVTFLNYAFRKIAGVSRNEDVSKLNLRDFHPNFEKISGSRANPVWSGEGTLLTRGGVEIPLSQVVVKHKNFKGSATSMTVISRDIGAYKSAEKRGWKFAEQLDASQKKFQVLVNSVDGIVWEAMVETGAFTFVSRRAERILG